MVAYEDLVVALTNWRITQGLPTGADAFAAFESGSVDLALPVAEPLEVSTGEVLALDSDDGIEELPDDGGEAQFDEFGTELETPVLDASEEESAASVDEEQVFDGASENQLEYDEETAYGDMPEMDEAGIAAGAYGSDEVAADESEAPVDEFAVEETAIASDEFVVEESEVADEVNMADGMEEEIAFDDAPVGDPQTEEVVMLADDSSVAEEPADEAVDLDNIEAEELVVESSSEEEANEFDHGEMPTKFGEDDDEREQTVMGMGIDNIIPADEE